MKKTNPFAHYGMWTAVLLMLALCCGSAHSAAAPPTHEPINGPVDALIVILTGVAIGAVGTLVGAGGGFLHVPILLIFYGFSPLHAIGTSTVAVFLNALSGTFSYINQERIDYELGVKFAVFAVPGVVFGAITTQYLNEMVFSLLLAVLLAALSYSLVFVREFKLVRSNSAIEPRTRVIHDSIGDVHTYSPDLSIGYGGSFLVGITSGLFGIGGGLIHVPLMNFIGIPVHVAAATSHFIITITSFFGIMIFLGLKAIDFEYALFLGVGVILGAYYGAKLSMLTTPDNIKNIIAGLLMLVAVRLIIGII